ncbi:MAG: flavin reductase family protein [Pirellulales bacterium]|nr:flavin reductase family protein [Pirellulales bacterium]
MPFDPVLQRRIMGHFASGVTIVTTQLGGEQTGMTVSAFASLSLNPPLVLVSIDRCSFTYEFLKSSRCFAVNMLRRDQEDLSRRFAMAGPKDFSDLPLHTAVTGAPILHGVLGWVDCRVVEVYRGGDHDIFVGEIVAGEAGEGEPLLYYCGRYRQIESTE